MVESCEGKMSLVNGENGGGHYAVGHQKLQNGGGAASPLHTPPLTPSARSGFNLLTGILNGIVS
jgi:hypothetical protein